MSSNQMKWGPSLILVLALLAGCATSLPKIETEGQNGRSVSASVSSTNFIPLTFT